MLKIKVKKQCQYDGLAVYTKSNTHLSTKEQYKEIILALIWKMLSIVIGIDLRLGSNPKHSICIIFISTFCPLSLIIVNRISKRCLYYRLLSSFSVIKFTRSKVIIRREMRKKILVEFIYTLVTKIIYLSLIHI